jgi:hypothetical protein
MDPAPHHQSTETQTLLQDLVADFWEMQIQYEKHEKPHENIVESGDAYEESSVVESKSGDPRASFIAVSNHVPIDRSEKK